MCIMYLFFIPGINYFQWTRWSFILFRRKHLCNAMVFLVNFIAMLLFLGLKTFSSLNSSNHIPVNLHSIESRSIYRSIFTDEFVFFSRKFVLDKFPNCSKLTFKISDISQVKLAVSREYRINETGDWLRFFFWTAHVL